MKRDMKIIGFAVCLLCGISLASAQENPGMNNKQGEHKQLLQGIPNPEKVAKQMTDQMQKELQLSEKQYKKIYKLNLKEQRERFKTIQESAEKQPSMGEKRGGERGEFPPMGERGERPMGMRGGGPGRMGMGERGSRMHAESSSNETIKKAVEAKEKKIKKILTTEQYEKWKTEQAARLKAAEGRGERKHNSPSPNGEAPGHFPR